MKRGSHPWDGKLYPVIRGEWVLCAGIASTLSALKNPSKSKCKPQDLAKAAAMRISPPASPTTRGAVRRMQEEESSPWATA
eukprot:1157234-Pelagomonas_calceolata.AAC.2